MLHRFGFYSVPKGIKEKRIRELHVYANLVRQVEGKARRKRSFTMISLCKKKRSLCMTGILYIHGQCPSISACPCIALRCK